MPASPQHPTLQPFPQPIRLSKLLIVALIFLVVRLALSYAYKDVGFWSQTAVNEFGIAEAAYNGHWMSFDQQLSEQVAKISEPAKKYVPIEAWPSMPHSHYSTFPARDLPGYGYVIAVTSLYLSDHLTTRYAFAFQTLAEMLSLLFFMYAASLVFGEAVAFSTGLIYIFAYPFTWGIVTYPLRDIFEMVVYGFYLLAFMLFLKRSDAWSYVLIGLLLLSSSLMLWIRPSAYYFFFFDAILIWFATNKSLRSRLGFFLLSVSLPLIAFGLPLRSFNLRHYGAADSGFIGVRLWTAMAVIRDNPYGFVYGDDNVLSWARTYTGNQQIKMFSPEMNQACSDYAWKIIREHPGFYLKAVVMRTKDFFTYPLAISTPLAMKLFAPSKLTLFQYYQTYPVAFFVKVFARIYGFIFYHTAALIAIYMLIRLKPVRFEMLLLMSPVLYSLLIQLPLYFEPRYLTVAAWVLCLPLAWAAHALYQHRQQPDAPVTTG